MRWRITKDPEIGDKRVDMKFAWLPVRAINKDEDDAEYWIWLTIYKRIQVYQKWTTLSCTGSWDRVIGWRTEERWIFNLERKKW